MIKYAVNDLIGLFAHIITYGQCETEGRADGEIVGLLLGLLEGFWLGVGVGAKVGLHNIC